MSRTALRIALPVVVIGLLAAGWAASRPTGSELPAAAASGSATATTAATLPAEQEADPAWWRTEVTLDSFVVRIGTMERGETALLDVGVGAPLPPAAQLLGVAWVAGAAQGQVAVVAMDGDDSLVLLVDAASGERREAFRSQDVIVDVELADGELIVLTGDRMDGAPRAAWSIDLHGGDPEPIIGLVAATSDLRLVAVVEWITDLTVSRDGGFASVLRCDGLDCSLRVLDRATGAFATHKLEWGLRPLAILGDVAVMSNVCVDIDCDVTLRDLATGATARIPRAGDGAPGEVVMVAGSDRLALTTMGDGGDPDGPSAFERIDLVAGEARRVVTQIASMRLVENLAMRWGAGMEVPNGSILVAGRRLGADPAVQHYFLVDADSGDVMPVPDLGERFSQG